ncbi:putative T7SS-secreted protein [Streptomyces sp. NPDC093094]|uniref:WXG100 family type VII secretion target n=1 Tax=Streptomyces sp. NPDC093094 TaxID=3366026 RepID=UPI00380B5D9E
MSHRPTDWHVLDLDKDPTPGDPHRIRQLAGSLHDFADDVGDALRDLKGIAKEDEILSWAGKTAEVFADEFGDAPKKLRKLRKSYDLAGDALASFWPDLQEAQEKADRALRDGRKARDELGTARTALTGADDWVRRATEKTDSYDPSKNGGKDVPKPDESEVRRATRDARHAKERQETAQRDVSAAQNALEAAKRLAAQARGLREEAARRTVTRLQEASDAGIPNRHWWEEIGDWVTDHWDEIVTVCKWVVTIVGIIVMIIGGPLGWLVFAAALIVLADTVRKMLNGTAGWGDLAWAVLDCIPATKGFTSLAKLGKLWKAGGLKALGAGAMKGIGGGLKNTADSIRQLKNVRFSLFSMMGKSRWWKADSPHVGPPGRAADDALPSDVPVYHKPGATAIGHDPATLRNFDVAERLPGYQDVIIHGTRDGRMVAGEANRAGVRAGGHTVHPNHVLDTIQRIPGYNGEPVRMLTCHSGAAQPQVIQEMANSLGVPVKAPTNAVGVPSFGEGPFTPHIKDEGVWLTFLPMA